VRKNFENRLKFNRDITMSMVSLWNTVYASLPVAWETRPAVWLWRVRWEQVWCDMACWVLTGLHSRRSPTAQNTSRVAPACSAASKSSTEISVQIQCRPRSSHSIVTDLTEIMHGTSCVFSDAAHKSVKLQRRYGHLTVFKMAAVRYLEFWKFNFSTAGIVRDPFSKF